MSRAHLIVWLFASVVLAACGSADAVAPAGAKPAAAPGAPGRVELAPGPQAIESNSVRARSAGNPNPAAKPAQGGAPAGGNGAHPAPAPAPAAQGPAELAPIEGMPDNPMRTGAIYAPGPGGKRPPPVVPAGG